MLLEGEKCGVSILGIADIFRLSTGKHQWPYCHFLQVEKGRLPVRISSGYSFCTNLSGDAGHD
jgi:hypothetical protein